jgi:hypothetical protein
MREKLLDDGLVLGPSGIVAVSVVGVQPLGRGPDPVEQRVAGLWRTDIVLEPDIHDDRTGDLVGKIDAIKVRDSLLDGVATLRMQA